MWVDDGGSGDIMTSITDEMIWQQQSSGSIHEIVLLTLVIIPPEHSSGCRVQGEYGPAVI